MHRELADASENLTMLLLYVVKARPKAVTVPLTKKFHDISVQLIIMC